MNTVDMAEVWNSAEWDELYDHAGEHSNDYAMRGGSIVEPIRKRNSSRHPASDVECGHCGRIGSATSRKFVSHVTKCERENRPYAYGTAR